MAKTVISLTLFGIASLISGIVNGLLGTGGGILLVYVLSKYMESEAGYNARDIFASVIACIFPMSVVSFFIYMQNGTDILASAENYILPGIVGGICGAFLLDKISLTFLKKLFSLMVIYAGVRFLL